MKTMKGRVVVPGNAGGEALVSRMPINFTAAFSKLSSAIPGRRSILLDQHHDLNGQNIKGKVIVFPTCIGSTFTGIMILQLIHGGFAPAAMIVQNADSLLVSGAVLGQVWLHKTIPVLEYPGNDLFDNIRSGDRVTVNGDTGEIEIG